MPDPTRPTSGRRLNQGALVVILTALMLVNLTTVGLLLMDGTLDEGERAADDVPALTQVDSHPLERPGLSGTERVQERGRERDAAVEDAVTSLAQPTEEPTASDSGVMPTPVVPPAAASSVEPIAGTQVVEPVSAPSPSVESESAVSPVEFFGVPIFE